MEHEILVKIPFESVEQAAIALESLKPDPVVKEKEFNQSLSVEGNLFIAKFNGTTDRTLRTGVNAFMESMFLIVETLGLLNPEILDSTAKHQLE